MRALLTAVVVLAASGCGGEGRCPQPGTCNAPDLACRTNADCFQSEFCNFAQDSCGTASADVGTCASRPLDCTAELDRVCGCDGQVYSNRCAAEQSGVDISNAGGCPPPTGTFACGATVCDAKTQMCLKAQPSDEVLGCQPIPASCQVDPTCACIVQDTSCECTQDVGLTVTCPIDF